MMTDKKVSFLHELRLSAYTIAVLSKLRTPQYGYLLAQSLLESNISIDQSTLYPLLRRFETQGLVISSWDTSNTRPRKYYVLSTEGIEMLQCLNAEWNQLSLSLKKLTSEDFNM